MPSRLRLVAKASALVAAAAVLFVAYRFGFFAQVANPKSLAQNLVAMGVWGYLVYVLAYALLQPFGVPGTVFIVAAPLIWPWPTAFALSMVGTMCASIVGFSFARFVARDWIASKIPPRFRKYDDALERHAFRTIVLLRVIFWMSPLLHGFLGISKVKSSTHLWGSLVGYILPILLVSYLGSAMFDEGGHLNPRAWPILGGLVAGALIIAAVFRYRAKQKAGLETP